MVAALRGIDHPSTPFAERLSRAWYDAGVAHVNSDRYPEALAAFTNGASIAETHGLLDLCLENLYMKAATLRYLGNLDAALEIVLNALDKAERDTGGDTLYTRRAALLRESAIIFLDLGDAHTADERIHQALETLNRDPGHPEYPYLSFIIRILEIETVWRSGKTERAFELLRPELDRWDRREELSVTEVNNILSRAGMILNELGRYEEADRYLTAMREYYDRLRPGSDPVKNTIRVWNARALTGLGNLHTADSLMNLALPGLRETFGDQGGFLIYATIYKARLEEAKGNRQVALAYLDEVIGSSVVHLNNREAQTAWTINSRWLLLALQEKATLLMRTYREWGDHSALRQSASTLDRAARLAVEQRQRLLREGAKLIRGQQSATIHEQALSASLTLYQTTGRREHLADAFRYIEYSKAGALKDLLAASRATRFGNIPERVQQRESRLQQRLTSLEYQLAGTLQDSTAKRQQLIETYLDVWTTRTRFLDSLETRRPDYFNLKYRSDVASLDSVQAALAPATGILNYLIGDSLLYIAVVTADTAAIVTVPWDEAARNDLRTCLVALRRLVGQKDFRRTAPALYHRLIAPVSRATPLPAHLIIIPDGYLHHLAFGALPGTARDYIPTEPDEALPYLIRNHRITYHYSATLWQRGRRMPESQPGDLRPFLGMAPMTSLPGSPEEVADIRNHFGEHNHDGDIRLGAEATREAFLRMAGDYRFLHIATHSAVDLKEPPRSAIYFATDSAQGDHNALTAGELYNLSLKADLVVLSSCESGFGQVLEGEGVMTLTRGFLYAGAHNVLASLWRVPDRATNRLMAAFYDGVLDGLPYDEALRQAKLRLIADPATASPHAWSAFVLIGE